jgi:hypothetical protein
VAIGLPSSFSVRVVDSWRGGSSGESTSPWYIPQWFHRARGFRLQVDGVYEFVPISIQPPTYAVAPTPIHAIVILPTVELPGMVRLYGDGTLIYNTSNIIRGLDKLNVLTSLSPLSDDISHPRAS